MAACPRRERYERGKRCALTARWRWSPPAASGIGRATADIMAREGAVVVAVDNHQERLDRAVAAMTAAGGRAHGRAVRRARRRASRRAGGAGGARVRPYRHPGQRGRRQHDHRQIRRHGRRTQLRRLAEADRLQPLRHLPLHPCGGAGDEGAARRQDRQFVVDRRPRPQRLVVERLRRRQGRHHRLHPQARLRARAVRHHHQRDRPEPHPDRAHPAALEPAEPGGPAGRDRPHAAAPHRRGRRTRRR